MRLKSMLETFKTKLDEMATMAPPPDDWKPDSNSYTIGGKRGSDLLIKIAQDGPMLSKNISSWAGVGSGATFRLISALQHTNYIGSTRIGYSLTSKGLDWVRNHGIKDINQEVSSNEGNATKAAGEYTYEPSISASNATVYRNDAEAIRKVQKALGNIASDSPLGKRTNIRSHGDIGFKYTEDPNGGSIWTVTIDIKKVGANLQFVGLNVNGKMVQVPQVDQADRMKILSEIEKRLKQDGINVNDLDIKSYSPEGDCAVVVTSGYRIPSYGIIKKARYVDIYDPRTGRIAGKELVAASGQMTLWPESVQLKINKLIEMLKK